MALDLQLQWEGRLVPTGTLYLDDLRELEHLLYSHSGTIKWTLSGNRQLGKGRISAATIDEIATLRNHIMDPTTLALSVLEYERVAYDKDEATGEQYYHNGGVLFQAYIHHEAYKAAWRASISASNPLRDRFEQCVHGVTEIFERASQTSWGKRHSRLATVIDLISWGPLFLAVGSAWSVCASIADNRLSPSHGDAIWLIGAFATLMVATGCLVILGKRIKANASWEPPHFDLRYERNQTREHEPPAILQRDVVIATLSLCASIAVAALVAAVWG